MKRQDVEKNDRELPFALFTQAREIRDLQNQFNAPRFRGRSGKANQLPVFRVRSGTAKERTVKGATVVRVLEAINDVIGDGVTATASRSELGKRAGCGSATAGYAITVLCSLSLVDEIKKSSSTGRLPSEFRICRSNVRDIVLTDDDVANLHGATPAKLRRATTAKLPETDPNLRHQTANLRGATTQLENHSNNTNWVFRFFPARPGEDRPRSPRWLSLEQLSNPEIVQELFRIKVLWGDLRPGDELNFFAMVASRVRVCPNVAGRGYTKLMKQWRAGGFGSIAEFVDDQHDRNAAKRQLEFLRNAGTPLDTAVAEALHNIGQTPESNSTPADPNLVASWAKKLARFKTSEPDTESVPTGAES